MNNAKDLFQKQKELASWWASVVDDPRFQQVLIYAHCSFHPDTMQHLEGATLYEHVLSTMASAEETGEDLLTHATPGLHHEIDKED